MGRIVSEEEVLVFSKVLHLLGDKVAAKIQDYTNEDGVDLTSMFNDLYDKGYIEAQSMNLIKELLCKKATTV